jgi:outer membrane protein assembly factor BamB/mono/diheme cytochrome c family protein
MIIKISKSIFLLSIFLTCFITQAKESTHGPGTYMAQRYFDGAQINASNINNLEKAWKFSPGKIDGWAAVQSSPIYTGTKIISTSPKSIFALDPYSGSLIWELDLNYGHNPRGITFTSNPNRRIYLPTPSRGVLEINEEDGEIIGYIGKGSVSVAPVINDKNIIIATRNDGIQSFNLTSKELVWHLNLETDGYKPTIWSGFSFDKETDLGYVITGSAGGLMGWYRTEPNLESHIIAFNANTGKIEWKFQYIEHDLWDLDLMGNPILLNLQKNGNKTKVVLVVTKKGDVILLNALNGKPFHENAYSKFEVQSSDIPREKTASMQKNFLIPEPFYDFYLDAKNDFNHLDKANKEFVEQKIRHVNQSGVFLPPSLNHDVLMYGINGGANKNGGAIDFSHENPSLIVPFNKEPWILRAFYTDKIHRLVEKLVGKYKSIKSSSEEEKIFQDNCASCHSGGNAPNRMALGTMPAQEIYDSLTTGIMSMHAQNITNDEKEELAQYLGKETQQMAANIFASLPFTPKNKIYEENCSSCHGISRMGSYEYESVGDNYYPPLVGVTLTRKGEDIEDFQKIKSIHQYFNASYNISEKDHYAIFDQFQRYDSRLNRLGLLSSRGFWQLLLDKEGYPATKPPWGGIAKIDLISGKKIWTTPFGARFDSDKNIIANGDKNFGGVLTTSSGLIFATGTPDSRFYAYDAKGNQIWFDQAKSAGSAPPISYEHNSCQFILFTATGGKVIPFTNIANKNIEDELIAYKLKSCG